MREPPNEGPRDDRRAGRIGLQGRGFEHARERIASLQYDYAAQPKEAVTACNLCGSDVFTVLTHRDRYGYPAQAHACSRCGLVFLNPIYFMLVFVADARHRARILALVIGALAGPPLHLVSADWGLLITGVVAGSIAFAADLVLPKARTSNNG